jgi:hypothetical protein
MSPSLIEREMSSKREKEPKDLKRCENCIKSRDISLILGFVLANRLDSNLNSHWTRLLLPQTLAYLKSF